jgi:hypothetical protein
MLSSSPDRRRYPRVPPPAGTVVAWRTTHLSLVSKVENFGLGGLYIRTVNPPGAGTFIQILLDTPTGEVRARAVVQRTIPNRGMGVKFVAMDQLHRVRFAGWLNSIPAVPAAPPLPR